VQSKKRATTITDIARAVNVSPKSVSRVVNNEPGVSEETRQRILQAISDMGYVANTAARNMRGNAKVIGLVTSGFEDYAGQVMRGASQIAQQFGYNLVLYVQHAENQPVEAYRNLIGGQLISALLMVVPYDYDLLVTLCAEYDMPYALVDYQGDTPVEDVPTITVTNRRGALEATRYLLALGHQRIGFITGTMDMVSARERLQGYQDALAEVAIPFDPTLVREGQWTQASGFAQTKALIEAFPDMSAVIASDDLMAFGAMDAIKECGLHVGEDVSVIGFDDIPMAATVYPPLTTVRQPMLQMGASAIELLIAQLEGDSVIASQREFATELVIRQSTAKAPAKNS